MSEIIVFTFVEGLRESLNILPFIKNQNALVLTCPGYYKVGVIIRFTNALIQIGDMGTLTFNITREALYIYIQVASLFYAALKCLIVHA